MKHNIRETRCAAKTQAIGRVCAILFCVVSVFVFGCGRQENSPKVLRLAYVYGNSELLHKAAECFEKAVEKESGGTIDVRLYPNGQLGKERETFEGLRLRSIDMMIAGSSILGWCTPEYAVVDTPFLFRDYNHLEKTWKGDVGDDMRHAMRERTGADMLELWFRGPRYLTTTSRIVKSPDDLPGLKLRVPEFEIYLKSWQAFGANVTPVPLTDLFMALKLGVVEGQENPLATIYSNNLQEVQKYVMRTEHLLGILVICVDKSFEKKFTESERKIILKTLRETTEWHNAEVVATEAEYEKRLREAGVEFVEVDRDAFQRLAREKIPPMFEDRWAPNILNRITEIE